MTASSARPRAVLHVGLAKCASTFIGDQAARAERRGVISASVWHPYDALIDACFRKIGIDVAFPNAVAQPVSLVPGRPYFATNECLTGHFPQPLRLLADASFDGSKLRAVQEAVAQALLQFARGPLSGYDVRVLLVARAPGSWLHSIYRNLVVMGVSQDPQSFLEGFASVFEQWADLDYLCGLYSSLFGGDSVELLPMELLRDDAAAFFSAVNALAGAPVLEQNEARNSGLSDGASERFRQLWEQIDRIVPPHPSWNDLTVRFKQQAWEFVHTAILNDESALARANEVWRNDAVAYAMPGELVGRMQARNTVVRDRGAFAPYLSEYTGSSSAS